MDPREGRSPRPSLKDLDERPLPRPRGLGLRAQIGLALVTTLALSVVLVGVAVDRLSTRALELERRRAANLAAQGLGAAIGRSDAPTFLVDRTVDALLATGVVTGLEIERRAGGVDRYGTSSGIGASAPIEGGAVHVWVAHPGDEAARRLVTLLVLYAWIAAAAILVLSYVLLTRLIVVPVEHLERAAARLARGEAARAPIEGAREIAALALAFNAMGEALRKEQATLEARLAELEATLRALEAAKARLEATQTSLVRSEKLASVGRLAAGVAHEIGNPLASILGLVELLRSGTLSPDEQADFLRRIQSETERIHRTIRNLLDYARGSGREASLGAVAGDVAKAIDDAVHLVTPQKDLRGVRIERRISEGLPPVRASTDHLTQVLLNLLINAADAIETKRASSPAAASTGETEDTILVEAFSQEGAGDPTNGVASGPTMVVIRVVDSGPGIDDKVLSSLFEPFVTTKPVGRGTGLGLAVCQSIVERAGGTITAASHPKGGAVLEVRLPAAYPGEGDRGARA